jgi:hypothetical protein
MQTTNQTNPAVIHTLFRRFLPEQVWDMTEDNICALTDIIWSKKSVLVSMAKAAIEHESASE